VLPVVLPIAPVLLVLLVLGEALLDAGEPPVLPILPVLPVPVLLPAPPLASLRPLFWSLFMLEPEPWLVSRALPSFDF
jgi:hypothetical protein